MQAVLSSAWRRSVAALGVATRRGWHMHLPAEEEAEAWSLAFIAALRDGEVTLVRDNADGMEGEVVA